MKIFDGIKKQMRHIAAVLNRTVNDGRDYLREERRSK